MRLGHLGHDSHNQGTMQSRWGVISASQPEVSLEGAGLHVGCVGPAAPLLGRDSMAMLPWKRSQTHPTSPLGSRPQEEGTGLYPASWPITGAAAQACALRLPLGQGHRQAGGWSLERDRGPAWGLVRVGGKGSQLSSCPLSFLDSWVFPSCWPRPY